MATPGGTGLGRFARAVYLPTAVFATGVGAVTPATPLLATALTGQEAHGAAMVALLGIGRILADVPAGKAAARWGDRTAMVWAAGAAVASLAGCALAPHWTALAACVLVFGGADAVFGLARQAFLSQQAPPELKARALSALGGVARIGWFAGPFGAAGAIWLWGIRSAFWLGAVAAAAAGLIALAARDPAGAGPLAPERRIGAARIIADSRHVFATIGTAVFLVGMVRATRNTVLPLWSQHIGIDDSVTALVFGLSGLIDALVFYPGGWAMDRLGRVWVAAPSMALMGACLVALPFVGRIPGLAIVAAVIGLGNGIGSGIVITLASDLSPPGISAQFLGVWRVLSDSGMACGPQVVSAASSAGSLAAGIWAVGGAGLAAAALFAVFLPAALRRAGGLAG